MKKISYKAGAACKKLDCFFDEEKKETKDIKLKNIEKVK